MCFTDCMAAVPASQRFSRKRTNNTAVGQHDAELDAISQILQVLAETETQMEAMSKTISEVSVHSQKKVISNPIELVQTVVHLQKIDKAASTISAVPTVVVPVVVNKDVVDDVVPLSGLNVQLKRVRDDA